MVDAVVGIGIFKIGGLEIVGQARQTRGVGGEIGQGDLAAPALGHGHRFGQISGDRVIQLDLAAPNHFGKQQRGEGLGDRADLEHGVAVDGAGIKSAAAAMRDDAPASRTKRADDDAEALPLLVDALGENALDLGIGGKVRGNLHRNRNGHRSKCPLISDVDGG